MDRYEVMTGKMMPLTDGAHRKWGFTGKVVTRSYERLVDALVDFVETGDGLKARFLTGFAGCPFFHDVRAGCKELTASLLAGMLGC